MMTGNQFNRARRLAVRLAGIELYDRHRELLDRRCRRAGVRDSAELELLLTAVEKGEAAATQKLLCLLTTKFTGFFRHPRHFEVAAEAALQVVRQGGCARFWSAGAATGEEPYSLAMQLIETFGRDDPPVTILATDLDTEALRVAQQGEYGEPALKALSQGRLTRFFCGAERLGYQSIAPEVRRLVEFGTLNLTDAAWPAAAPFDVIFCRNVLMYLSAVHREAVSERLVSSLTPEGILILDPVEHLGGIAPRFFPPIDGVHRLRPSGAPCLQQSWTSALSKQRA